MLISSDLQTISSEESNDEQQHFSISILWKRKWIVALYCLICSAYIAVEKRRIVSSSKSTHITQPHLVKITIIPSSPSTFHHSTYEEKSDKHPNKNYLSYDSMPALFGRPLKENNIIARLISNNRFDDNEDDDFCSRTGHLNLNEERAMDESNVSATIGEIVQPQGFEKFDDNHDTEATMCHIDDPVAFLVPRGGCSFQHKAVNAITYPPIMEQNETDPHHCYIPITFLIIYDDQIEQQQQQENEEEEVKTSNNDDKASSHLLRMRALDGEANKLEDETPISLLFVSYETGIALKQAMRKQTRSNDDKFDDENGSLMINLNPGYMPDVGGSSRKHHKSHNDDTADDFIDDNYYPVESSSEAAILVHMITVMSLMFTFFVCIGCWIVCCCGPPGEEGGLFTIRMDRNGFVFGRPASNDAEGAARLLTEEEVLMLDEIEFSIVNNGNDGSFTVGYNNSGVELEDGLNNVNKREDIAEIIENPPSFEKLLIQRNWNTKNNDDSISSSSSITRTPPLHHQISSSPLNRESLNWNAMCSICLEDFEDGEKLRMLPCHHLFHTECVLPWLTERFSNCPLCKAQIIPEDVEEESTTTEGPEDESNTIGDEVAVTTEGGLNETDGQQESGLSLRNLFLGLSQNFATNRIDANRNGGGQRQILLLDDNEISSNLSTPLLQDSISRERNSSS